MKGKMLNTIYEWNPRKSYKDYPDEKKCNKDYVCEAVIESGYVPKLPLKDYVLTIIIMCEYWNKRNTYNPDIYIMDSTKKALGFLGGRYELFDEGGHWYKFVEKYIDVLMADAKSAKPFDK